MSIINILTRTAPKIDVFQFDAVLEDSFEASVELTRYPVESGVKVADHRIINPMKYYMVGAVSNNPMRVFSLSNAVGLAAGGISNFFGSNAIGATAAGLAGGLTAAYLAGSAQTRASSALETLINMMVSGQPFEVDAVDIQLKDMVITRLSRDRDPETEGGLIFVAELQELVQLDRLIDKTQPSQDQLPDGDPAKAGAASTASTGQQVGGTPGVSTVHQVNMVDGITMTPL